MTNRELDAWIAKNVFGLNVVAMDWPCGICPDSGIYEANQLPDEADYSWFNEKDPVYANKDDIWPPMDCGTGFGRWTTVKPVKFYSSKIEDAWEVAEKMYLHVGPWQKEEGLKKSFYASNEHNFNYSNWIIKIADTVTEAICLCAKEIIEKERI